MIIKSKSKNKNYKIKKMFNLSQLKLMVIKKMSQALAYIIIKSF